MRLGRHFQEQQAVKFQHYDCKGQHLRHLQVIHNAPISGTDALGQADAVNVLAQEVPKKGVEKLLPDLLVWVEAGEHGACRKHKIEGVRSGLDAGSVRQKLPKDLMNQCQGRRLHHSAEASMEHVFLMRVAIRGPQS